MLGLAVGFECTCVFFVMWIDEVANGSLGRLADLAQGRPALSVGRAASPLVGRPG